MKTSKKLLRNLSEGMRVLSLTHCFNIKGGDMKVFSQLTDEEKKRFKEARSK